VKTPFMDSFCDSLFILPCEKIFDMTRKEEFNIKIYSLLLTHKRHKEVAQGEDQGG